MTFHPAIAHLLASGLIAIGLYAVLTRRHALALLMGVELMLAGIGVIFVTTSATVGASTAALLALFLITIAAAEVVLALALFVLWRSRGGHIDLREPS